MNKETKNVTNQPSSLQMFSNPEFGEIRTVMVNNEPWFVAADVCKALEIQNVTQAIQKLENDERSMFNIGRQGKANCVNEYGLYTLVLTSRKTCAKDFKRWITHEIIPTIRKTGGYVQPEREEEFINMYFPSFSEDVKLAMVQDLRAKNEQLKTENEKLRLDNKALSSSILEWEDRAKLNAGIRKLAITTGKGFGEMWNKLYQNLKYKFHIDLKLRGKRQNESYLSTVKEDEWSKVIQTFSALCEELDQSPSEMINVA